MKSTCHLENRFLCFYLLVCCGYTHLAFNAYLLLYSDDVIKVDVSHGRSNVFAILKIDCFFGEIPLSLAGGFEYRTMCCQARRC